MSEFSHRIHRAGIAFAALLLVALGIVALVTSDKAESRGASGNGGVQLTEIGNFDEPVQVVFAPGEEDKVYVVEQTGTVQLIDGGGAPTQFMDISDAVKHGGEQGLLSVAFHPDFPAQPYVYAFYTDAPEGDLVISQYETTATDANEATRIQTLRIRHRANTNHNGGTLQWGFGGHLFLSTGDGGGSGDPHENAQNKNRLLGKLLRITPELEGGHTEPSGNPFVGRPGADEILARGLRNPYRFSFDSETGRVYIGDVGQNRYEEVNAEGWNTLVNANFGWDRYEGRKRYRDSGRDVAKTPRPKRHTKPVLAYGRARDGGSCSVIGGYVVHDPDLPALDGRYVYADFCGGRIWSFLPAGNTTQDNRRLNPLQPDGALENPSGWGEDPISHEIYVTSLNGPVFRLDPAP